MANANHVYSTSDYCVREAAVIINYKYILSAKYLVSDWIIANA